MIPALLHFAPRRTSTVLGIRSITGWNKPQWPKAQLRCNEQSQEKVNWAHLLSSKRCSETWCHLFIAVRLLLSVSICEVEISSIVKKLHPLKEAGTDGSLLFILKFLGSRLVSFPQPLFQACISYSYHLTAFCQWKTVTLRKSGKGDYSAPKAKLFIALLN